MNDLHFALAQELTKDRFDAAMSHQRRRAGSRRAASRGSRA